MIPGIVWDILKVVVPWAIAKKEAFEKPKIEASADETSFTPGKKIKKPWK